MIKNLYNLSNEKTQNTFVFTYRVLEKRCGGIEEMGVGMTRVKRNQRKIMIYLKM